MASGNGPAHVTKIRGIKVAIFDNGAGKKLGVSLERGMSRIFIRPGHAQGLREIADWLEQTALSMGHRVGKKCPRD
jgi:hypothetical protein